MRRTFRLLRIVLHRVTNMIGCPGHRGSLGSYGYILQLEGPDTPKDIIYKPALLWKIARRLITFKCLHSKMVKDDFRILDPPH